MGDKLQYSAGYLVINLALPISYSVHEAGPSHATSYEAGPSQSTRYEAVLHVSLVLRLEAGPTQSTSYEAGPSCVTSYEAGGWTNTVH